ncbi:hypothetical protein V8G54_010407 [Vigna mungo]|uniref:Uncharacterized protein n=1 Tax=Vigna mungo TaxID=3915 RepID=A0AAQ3NXZ2_VIGMU
MEARWRRRRVHNLGGCFCRFHGGLRQWWCSQWLREEEDVGDTWRRGCHRGDDGTRDLGLSLYVQGKVQICSYVEGGEVEGGDNEVGQVEGGEVEVGDIEVDQVDGGEIEVGDIEVGQVDGGEVEVDEVVEGEPVDEVGQEEVPEVELGQQEVPQVEVGDEELHEVEAHEQHPEVEVGQEEHDDVEVEVGQHDEVQVGEHAEEGDGHVDEVVQEHAELDGDISEDGEDNIGGGVGDASDEEHLVDVSVHGNEET